MFKGLAALFTSGAILNPMIWGGIILGLVLIFNANAETITGFYENYNFYLLVLLIAGLYNFLFKKVYTEKGDLNWAALTVNVIFSAVKFVFSSLLTISFVTFLSF